MRDQEIMENFFRPKRLHSHGSLVSQFLSPRHAPASLHQTLHAEAHAKQRAKDVRDHVSSKAHRTPAFRGCTPSSDGARERRREHWETAYHKSFREAPKVSAVSRELAYYRQFQGERVHCVNPLRGGEVYLTKTPRPVLDLDIAGLEARYGLDLRGRPAEVTPAESFMKQSLHSTGKFTASTASTLRPVALFSDEPRKAN